MQELNMQEARQVAGGAGLLAPLGQALVNIDTAANQFLNTPLISSVGLAFNKYLGLPGQLVHFAADGLGYLVFATVADVGHALGGVGDVPYHFFQPGEPGTTPIG